MKTIVRFVAVLTLIVGAQTRAKATDYCPEGYYGFMNGYYMYFCHYCDPLTGCTNAGAAVDNMYSCGGDFPCCLPGSSCIDPIPGGAIHLNETAPAKTAPQKSAGGAKKAALASHAAKAARSPRIPMLIGEAAQTKYLSADEKFILPGDHVTKDFDAVVAVREADGSDSYFRLLQVTYTGKDPENQATIFFGMEMDPKHPPVTANTATRQKKGQGKVYKHTVKYKGDDYDVSSVRVLPDAS